MKKIYKLKEWYSLEDASQRLSQTLEEEVSVAEVLELSLDGHLKLYWFMRHVSAQEVKYETRPMKLAIDHDGKISLNMEGKDTVEVGFSDYFPINGRERVSKIEGPHLLRLDLCGALEDYLRSHLTNTGGDLTSLDGFFVEDQNGTIFQVMEAFEESFLKNCYPNEKISFNDIRGYFPSVNWPELSELGFTKQELERFERTFQNNEPKPVLDRERQSFYKLLIAMAVDGYGYDPKASRSPISKELEGVLDRLGLKLSDDTIRQKLKEASELLDASALD